MRYLSPLYPVPKSSMEHRTPMSSRLCIVALAACRSRRKQLSVISSSSKLGARPLRSRAWDTRASILFAVNSSAERLIATGTCIWYFVDHSAIWRQASSRTQCPERNDQAGLLGQRDERGRRYRGRASGGPTEPMPRVRRLSASASRSSVDSAARGHPPRARCADCSRGSASRARGRSGQPCRPGTWLGRSPWRGTSRCRRSSSARRRRNRPAGRWRCRCWR